MKNIIILGSGRSGTSMVAGCFSSAGYFMGDDLLPARDANPKGFFEDEEVNDINECILEPVTPARPPFGRGRFLFKHRPLYMQRWLACLPVSVRVEGTPSIRKRIDSIVRRQPFCLKDPRFCYTLPVWREMLGDLNVLYVCVFRDPRTTVESILTECRTFPPLAAKHDGIHITRRRAYSIWIAMYRQILEKHINSGTWHFVHYDQIASHNGIDALAQKAGVELDFDFPTQSLKRSVAKGSAPRRAMQIYHELCRLAKFES